MKVQSPALSGSRNKQPYGISVCFLDTWQDSPYPICLSSRHPLMVDITFDWVRNAWIHQRFIHTSKRIQVPNREERQTAGCCQFSGGFVSNCLSWNAQSGLCSLVFLYTLIQKTGFSLKGETRTVRCWRSARSRASCRGASCRRPGEAEEAPPVEKSTPVV